MKGLYGLIGLIASVFVKKSKKNYFLYTFRVFWGLQSLSKGCIFSISLHVNVQSVELVWF
ncbi:MAG: hypothetical protein CMF60_02580 [Magnetococcales bacterium]|nr:hypothetical protein [Magnetococcales bacterium]